MVQVRAGVAADAAAGAPEANRQPFEERLRELMRGVADGSVTVEAATRALRDLPFADLGFAKVDHHRELRQGLCEVVYAEGKTIDQVEGIVSRLLAGNRGPVLVTRASPRQRAVVRSLADVAGHPVAEIAETGAIAVL
ncbi:MAG TPA: hypothetical protein VEM93_10370, partial [Actinomycetota bacterium]|nr:hypothetical protein [Actinomycetota bacterium]